MTAQVFLPFYLRGAFFQCTEIELKPQCNNPAPSNSASNGDSFSGIAMAPERTGRNRGRHKRMTKTSSNLVVPSVIHRFSSRLFWLKSFREILLTVAVCLQEPFDNDVSRHPASNYDQWIFWIPVRGFGIDEVKVLVLHHYQTVGGLVVKQLYTEMKLLTLILSLS